MHADVYEVLAPQQLATLRCLWISRVIPFPENDGSRTYSSRLSQSLASAGAELTFVGFATESGTEVPAPERLSWVPVQGGRKPYWQALLSDKPLVVEAHATPAMRRCVDRLLNQTWDVIVIDNYAALWALDAVLVHIEARPKPPLLVYVSHNFEEGLAETLAKAFDGLWMKRAVLRLNHRRIRTWERRLVEKASIVSAVTEEDRQSFMAISSRPDYLVLSPGRTVPETPKRHMDASIPRHVLLVGSFRWIIKQQNLEQLLSLADAKFADAGIVLDIVGDVPDELLLKYRGHLKATLFHGFVKDLQPLFSASRMALVPEVVGGGFKLKFLDYIFGRVPVVAIASATAGLPTTVAQNFILGDDMGELVSQVIANIDRLEMLDGLQCKAYEAAASSFDWKDRGIWLRDAIYAKLAGR